ncbi:MAG: L-histidine N(alpha)-methyltransferase [Bacteroidales bacterium]|nr:L-histidine N(alpha)-methyltransferase [Bacteroidales bacterium]
MNYYGTEVIDVQQIKITNHLKDLGINNIRKEIIDGLKAEQKYISSKFFYDEKGSKLFEDITRLPEYYPTRTEKKLLKEIAPELMSNLHNIDIVEPGSGDCSKISILLQSIPIENLKTINYIPIDISHSAISESAQNLTEIFPDLSINGLVADFINQIELFQADNKRMFCFLGSTLGNFNEDVSNGFLINLSSIMHTGDTFLLGLDLVKPVHILHDAYNDSQNITAAFNKNILSVINNIIDSNFDIDDFEHKAFFNEQKSRIEMHLTAKEEMTITSPYTNSIISIKKGENIHTENSYKYSPEQIKKFEKTSGLTIKSMYTDPNKWFALVLFEKNI